MNSATEHRTCPSCGAAIPANAPQGICPKCLMAAAALATEAGQTGGKRPEPPSLERLAVAFPQLEVIEFIGQGGMGAVYKARQKQLDRVVALKVLPPGIGGDPSFAERFTREAKALAKLLHPNIVALFEFGQADGIYYLLMEFVDGVSLGQLLRSSRVSPREALAIVPQICDALQYAHDQGIVHRDIKPENILLDRRGRVKVADFGLAKLVEANAPLTPALSPSDGERVAGRPGAGENSFITAAGKIMGTPNYMAPEQVDHPGEVDHRADIYALGVVFYQMLTGELPGKRIEAPSKKVQIDVRLDEVVLRALERKPELRYQQVSVLKTQVETIVATPPGSSQREEAQIEPSHAGRNEGRLTGPQILLRSVLVAAGVWLLIFAMAAAVTSLLPSTYVGTARVKLTSDDSNMLQNEFARMESPELLKQVVLAADLKRHLNARWKGMLAGSSEAQQMELLIVLLRGAMDLQPVHGTSIVTIKYNSDSASEASEIANAIASAYCGQSGATILDKATVPAHPARPNALFNLTIGAVGGGLVGLVAGGLTALYFALRKLPRTGSATAPPTGTSVKDGAGEATTLCATKKKKGEFIGVGCAFQALGLACFFIPSVGWILGIILLLLGGHMALKLLCSHCGNPTTQQARICTTCGAHFLPKGASAPSSGQVEEQRSKFAWIGTLPKLNGPFVVMRGNRRVLNWPVIGYNVGMVLAMICVVLRIMDSSMSFQGSRANLILLFGLFAVVYIVRGWRDSLTALEAQSAQLGVAPAPALGRDYRTRQTLLGLPLVHVTWGIDPATSRPRVAKGVVAVGPVAIGVIAVGFSAWGLFPCGLVAGGLLPVGILFAVGFAAVGFVAAGFQAVGLCAVAFWHAVGLVAAGPTAVGLERVLVGQDVVVVPFVLAFVAACLMDWLMRTIGRAIALAAGVAGRKGQEGASDPARAAAPRASQGIRVARTIGSIAAVLVCVLLFGTTWFRQLAARNGQWERRALRPSPAALQNPLACLRVTDVSREGNIVLFRIVSEAGFPAHLLTAEFRGPGIPIMPGAYGSYHYNGPDLSCLLGPDETATGYADGTHFTGNNLSGWLELVSGKRKVFRVGNRQHGPGEFLYGFYLPDPELAEMAMKQGREVCLGKTNYLGSGASVLLLFDFKRFAGKDAAGKDIWQLLTASLGVTPDFDAARRDESK